MERVWAEEFRIKFNEVDFNNRVKISTLFNYMQEAAVSHALKLRMNYIQDSDEKNLIWVLSRTKIKIRENPGYREKIIIETWPKCIDGPFAVRDFLIKNDKSEEIAGATTAWLLVDLNSRRPIKVDLLREEMSLVEEKHGINEPLLKLKQEWELQYSYKRQAVYSDIDVNKHVNNTKYIDWIIDSFPPDFYKTKQLDSLRIDLLSETKLGDKLSIQKGHSPDNSNIIFFTCTNDKSLKRVFQAETKWIDI